MSTSNEKHTPGPWIVEANADLIASAPDLLSENNALKERNQQLEKELATITKRKEDLSGALRFKYEEIELLKEALQNISAVSEKSYDEDYLTMKRLAIDALNYPEEPKQ